MHQTLHERQQRRAFIVELPVDPAERIVLAVDVVVAVLRVARFVAGQQHRGALRQQQCRQQIALLPTAQRTHVGVVSRAFGTAIPRKVVAAAVAIVLAVGLVVLVVIRHQIIQREAIVCGYEIDAGRRLLPRPAIQVLRAGQAFGKIA